MSRVKIVNVDSLSQTLGCLVEKLRVAASAKPQRWSMSNPKGVAAVKLEPAKDSREKMPCAAASARTRE